MTTDSPEFSSLTFENLPVDGTYFVSETPNPEFDLVSVACVLEDGTPTGVVDTLGVTGIEVLSGQTTVCTFVNAFIQPVGLLRVVKESDAPGQFVFEGTPDLGQFTLNTADSATSEITFELTDVTSLYSIAETPNPLFDFIGAECTLESGVVTGILDVATITISEIQVNLGETTTCVFENASPPIIPPAGVLPRGNR